MEWCGSWVSTHQRVTTAFNDAGGKHYALRINTTPEGEHREITTGSPSPEPSFPNDTTMPPKDRSNNTLRSDSKNTMSPPMA